MSHYCRAKLNSGIKFHVGTAVATFGTTEYGKLEFSSTQKLNSTGSVMLHSTGSVWFQTSR